MEDWNFDSLKEICKYATSIINLIYSRCCHVPKCVSTPPNHHIHGQSRVKNATKNQVMFSLEYWKKNMLLSEIPIWHALNLHVDNRSWTLSGVQDQNYQSMADWLVVSTWKWMSLWITIQMFENQRWLKPTRGHGILTSCSYCIRIAGYIAYTPLISSWFLGILGGVNPNGGWYYMIFCS